MEDNDAMDGDRPRLHLTRNILLVVAWPTAILFCWAAIAMVFVSIFVFPPDVIFAEEKILASHNAASGDLIEFTQFWNRSDFYTTTVRRTDPTGTVFSVVVDGDDAKIWKAQIRSSDTVDRLVIIRNGQAKYWLDSSNWHLTYASDNRDWERWLRD